MDRRYKSPPGGKIPLPFLYQPRQYQIPLFVAGERGIKRFCTVWHRRSGKDTTWLNFTIRAAYERVGTYIHLFPQLKRGRKVLWEGRNREGMPFLSHIPQQLIKRKREDEMMIELRNGSVWRIEGQENLDSVVGMNPIGIVYSEFSQQRRAAWDLVRPILNENGGWAAFNFTPRGRLHHSYELYQMALTEPDWYASLLTVEETRRDAPGEDGSAVITLEDIAKEQRQGLREALMRQEYYCDFNVGSTLQFIPVDYIQAAVARVRTEYPWAPVIMGIDVGRNRDRAVLLVRQGGMILASLTLHPQQLAHNPSAEIVGWLGRYVQEYQPDAIFVDGVGIGVGVIDLARLRGYSVQPVLGNATSLNAAYFNLRAYMWGEMREWVRTIGQLERPRDTVLEAELQWPQWRWKGDKEWLTPKDELEGETDDEMEYVSPDEADALALTFAAPVSPRVRQQRGPWVASGMDFDPVGGALVASGMNYEL